MTNTQRKTWATQAFHGVYYRHAMHVSDKAMSNVITSIPTQQPAKGIVQERNVVHGASIDKTRFGKRLSLYLDD